MINKEADKELTEILKKASKNELKSLLALIERDLKQSSYGSKYNKGLLYVRDRIIDMM